MIGMGIDAGLFRGRPGCTAPAKTLFQGLALGLLALGCADDRQPARDDDHEDASSPDTAVGHLDLDAGPPLEPVPDAARPLDLNLRVPDGSMAMDAVLVRPELDAELTDSGEPMPPCLPAQTTTGTLATSAVVSGDGLTDLAKVEVVRRADTVPDVPGSGQILVLYGRPDGGLDAQRTPAFDLRYCARRTSTSMDVRTWSSARGAAR